MKSNVPLTWRGTLLWTSLAAVSFHVAYLLPGFAPLVGGTLYALLQLTRQPTNRRAFYVGLAAGFILYAPQLRFFYTIFGPAAGALWLVLAFWLGVFCLLTRNARLRLTPAWFVPAAAVIWTGLEFFRSELYYLRFSWLNAGFAYGPKPPAAVLGLSGGYGLGFLLMLAAAATDTLLRTNRRAAGFVAVPALGAVVAAASPFGTPSSPDAGLEVAGVQLEFPAERQVTNALNQALEAHPNANLFVLSEYTFDGPPPGVARDWCRLHRKHLLVGGRQPAGDGQFFNTAFVVDPSGEIVFQQAKSVPIQFFKDGLPAPRQNVWRSPWGKIGICICYDLSYARVTDELIRQGAQALIVPTMDVSDWGEAQHKLHARVAPVRASEYGVAIFRLASSGISQLIDERGGQTASAPFPGEGAIIGGRLPLVSHGRLPLDRWLAPLSVGLTAALVAWLGLGSSRRARPRPGSTADPVSRATPDQKS